MKALLFHMENHRDSASGNVWDYACRAYGLTLLRVSQDPPERAKEPQLRFTSLEQAREYFSGCTIVWCVPEGDIPGSPVYGGPPGSHAPAIPYEYLHEFDHPADDVIYVFGPDSGELKMRERIRDGDKVINIKTVDPVTQMHAVVAGTSVASARYIESLR